MDVMSPHVSIKPETESGLSEVRGQMTNYQIGAVQQIHFVLLDFFSGGGGWGAFLSQLGEWGCSGQQMLRGCVLVSIQAFW